MKNKTSKVKPSKEFGNEGKTTVLRRFLEDISKEKKIPIERLIIGVMQGDLYVWDYDSGRHFQDQFRVLSINRV
ncbi:MAG: hypothetical protein R2831_10940 [Chitinophagaceae bacterium]